MQVVHAFRKRNSPRGGTTEKVCAPPEVAVPDTVTAHEVVRIMARLRQNNVILHGIVEEDAEDLLSIAQSLPGISSPDVIENIERLGQRNPGKCRPVRAVLTVDAKKAVMAARTRARYKDRPVYVHHDLTPAEQTQRRKVLPPFKALRDKGVVCYLPRSEIIKEGM